jgi:hypothetical protein
MEYECVNEHRGAVGEIVSRCKVDSSTHKFAYRRRSSRHSAHWARLSRLAGSLASASLLNADVGREDAAGVWAVEYPRVVRLS